MQDTLFLSYHLILISLFSLDDSKLENFDYLLKAGSDTDFVLSWDENCLLGHGNTKGTTMDYILAFQSLNLNAALSTEECKYVFNLKFKFIFSSSILK
jgi:hypothetical protein